MADYFTEDRIKNYGEHEPINVRYNLGILSLEGITPGKMKGKRVLDVGCGFGMLAGVFHNHGAETYGTDSSGYAIKVCKNGYSGVDFKVSECHERVFDGKFDLITCFGVLGIAEMDYHLPFLKTCKEQLSDDGVLVATAPNYARPLWMGKPKNDYRNARDTQFWKALLDDAGLDGKVYPVLRIPLPDKFGVSRFIKGFGDPLVLVARRTRPSRQIVNSISPSVSVKHLLSRLSSQGCSSGSSGRQSP
jgi:SAM-dependent methyltransferase